MDSRLGRDAIKPAAGRIGPQVPLRLVRGRGEQHDIPVDVEDLAYLKVTGGDGLAVHDQPAGSAPVAGPDQRARCGVPGNPGDQADPVGVGWF